MSMLVERKRKQKFSLNPQGNLWKKETNTFGQKMLQRMGWKEGKGLGRNEDGQTSHVKVSFKNDTNGMGFKESDEPAVHQDDFNTLLKSLSNSLDDNSSQPLELKSLEEQSQKSRARVHYKKFTRGKDLSRCSEKDLANIFGKKKLTAESTPQQVETNGNDHSYGVNTIAGGSMTDYFKNKLTYFDKRNGFGFKSETVTEDEGSNDHIEDGDANIRKSKKSKNKNEPKSTFVSHVSTEHVESDSTSKKKKKRKCSQEQCEETVAKKPKKGTKEDLGLTNPAFEPLGNSITIEKRVLNTITENDAEDDLDESVTTVNDGFKAKKKNKGRSNEDEGMPASECLDEIVPVSNKKSKAKRKREATSDLGLVNPAFESNKQENVAENDLNKEGTKKKKKKSKCNDNGTENPSFVLENVAVSPEAETEEKPKKKKKQKRDNESGSFAIDNPTFNSNDDSESKQASQEYEVKRKSKKKSKGLDNPALDLNDSNTSQNRSENKSQPNGVENSAADILDSDIMINVTNEPVKTPKAAKNNIGERNAKVTQDGLRRKRQRLGWVNHGFDAKAQRVEESIKTVSNRIDRYQAEVENGINESKEEQIVGEINTTGERDEALEEGAVLLQYKYAKFGKMPQWARSNDVNASLPKKSYRHLIQSDIIVQFKNTNLHKIDGYGMAKIPGGIC